MSRKYRMAKNLSFMVMIGMMFIVISMNVNALGLNNNTAVPNINQSNIIRWYRLNDTDGNMTNTTVLAMGLNVTGAFTSQYGSPDPYTTSTGAISFTGSAQYLTSGAVASTGNIAELGFAADFSVDGWVQHFRDFANDGGAEEWLFNCIERASAGRPLWGIHSESNTLAIEYNGATQTTGAGETATFAIGWHYWALILKGTNLSVHRDTKLIYNYSVTVADLADCTFHVNVQLQSGTYGSASAKALNFSDITIASRAYNQEDLNCRYNGTNCQSGAGPAAEDFKVTVTDLYDSKTITNFTVIIYNATNRSEYNTTSGTLSIFNSTIGIYNITINSSQDGGYFNRTYDNYNISTDLAGQIYQSLLNLYVNDSLTKLAISSFTAVTNFTTTSVNGGYILLYTKQGTTHQLNISSSQYPKQTRYYSINALENNSMTVNLSPQFQFYLRREADNSLFDIQGTNTTKLTIYCPAKNIVINFKNNSAESRNSTQENTTIDCPYTLLKMDVSYPSSSYFRSLIPPTSQQNVTWWLLDLNKDTGVQMIINLRDLTGEFSQGILRAKTAIGSNNENIIEEYFDISTSVVLYLLKDALYKIILINNDKTKEKQLGDLIADAAGTKTITAQDISFIPDTILDNNVSWSYTFNASANILRLQYLDSTRNTTYIRWRIYNGTNASAFQLLTTFESVYVGSNFTSTTYTYNNVQFNRTYYTHLFVQHSGLSFNISQYRSFGEYENYLGSFAGFTAKATKDIKHYGSAIFLSVWMLLFSARHMAIGLTSTLFWVVILKFIGWFLIGWIWITIIGLITFVAWIADYMRRN